MADFDPDAYLAAPFDPDKYLQGTTAAPPAAPAAPPPERSIFGKLANALGAPDPYAAPDPNGVNATVGRIASTVLTGLPDLAIKIQNAGLNPFDMPGRIANKALGIEAPDASVPEVGPYVRAAAGVPEMPADASTTRKLLEGGAAAIASGGANAAGQAFKAAPTTLEALRPAAAALTRGVIAPTVGSYYGGEVGGAVGGDTGALIGSLAGGLGPAARVTRQASTRAGAKPDAAAIAAIAERENIPTTAGLLGGPAVQAQEKALSGKPGAANVIRAARGDTLAGLRDAVQRAIEERQALPAVTPETADIHGVASKARAGGSDASSAAQARLMERVTPTAQVDVTPVLAELEAIRRETDPGTAAPIVARIEHLKEMFPRDAQGNVISATADYQRFKDWRTGIGRRSQGLDPVPGRFNARIYEAATNAMKDTAVKAGVHPQEFDLAQGITRNQMRAGEITEQYDKTLGNTMADAAGPRGFAKWWYSMTPQEQTAIAGPQKQRFDDFARLSKEFNYPTSQTGLTQAVGSQVGEGAARVVGAGIGTLLGKKLGIPGGEAIGAAVGSYGKTPLNWLQAKMLEGQGRKRAMLQDVRPVSMDELRAALTAASRGANY
jgi:hypothetical protein